MRATELRFKTHLEGDTVGLMGKCWSQTGREGKEKTHTKKELWAFALKQLHGPWHKFLTEERTDEHILLF